MGIAMGKTINLSERILKLYKRQAFLTVNDDKDNFINYLQHRLFNPTKITWEYK